MLRVGIIGAGLMGQKRAAHLQGAQLVAVSDSVATRAVQLAKDHGAAVESTWKALVQRSDVDLVFVCTSHDNLLPCALAALAARKHVLVEKPGGRNPAEIKKLIDGARKAKRVLKVGFNHRFHPAFQKANLLLKSNELGPLMYLRARYGHGGRPGYEKEWRANPKISGGGELLDQGVHLIDLCRWIGGDFRLQWGVIKTFFWPMPVEDNGFLYLETPNRKCSAFLHASWTEWKNLFDFEIFCQRGKIEISGLGRSYGTEELRIYRMKPEMGPPDLETLTFPGEDISWKAEFDALVGEINGQTTDIASAPDALRTLEIVTGVYRRKKSAGKR